MKKLFIAFALPIFAWHFAMAQTDSIKVKHFGLMGTFDYAYNFQDKVLNSYTGLKCSVGISYTDKKKKYIVFMGTGLKPIKTSFYPITFRQGFAQHVQQNYVPGKHYTEDSLIGSLVSSKSTQYMGNVSYYL